MIEQLPTKASERLAQVMERLKAEGSGKMDPEVRKENIRMLYYALKEEFQDAGGVFLEDMNDVMRRFMRTDMIVRREDPERAIRAIRTRSDLEILQDEDKKGDANSALWKGEYGSDGLDTALLEGHGQIGGLVTLVGFMPGDALQVTDLPHEKKISRGKDRRHVRSVEGRVPPADIRFLILRIPGAFFPEEDMTDAERDLLEEDDTKKKGWPVFRAFVFPAQEQAHAA